jgi:hypothetical protein
MVIFNITTFMQVICIYIPQTNRVSTEYSVAAILLLLFMVHITLFAMLHLLYFYISTSRSGAWGSVVVKALHY